MRIKRVDILNHLAARFSYSSYLEIGVAGGSTFRAVNVAERTGVDPRWRLWSALRWKIKKRTSDQFFAHNSRTFDLVLIDGLHVAAQTYRDIQGSLAALRPGGSILVHDCLPSTREQQQVPRISVSWTGDVWRAFLRASQDPGLRTLIFATDRGCGWIRRFSSPSGGRPPLLPDRDPLNESDLTWEEFERRRDEWLEIVPADQVFARIDQIAASELDGR